MTRTTGTLAGCGAMAAGLLLATCAQYPVALPPVRSVGYYRLEVLNNADESVRVQLIMWARFRAADGKEGSRGSGIIDLSANEKKTFFLDIKNDLSSPTPDDNRQMRGFSEIRFYDETGDEPYNTYRYEMVLYCGLTVSCWAIYVDVSDETVTYVRTDGLRERLFVKAPDRPFYLERDREDLGLGRVVITFVPTAEREVEA